MNKIVLLSIVLGLHFIVFSSLLVQPGCSSTGGGPQSGDTQAVPMEDTPARPEGSGGADYVESSAVDPAFNRGALAGGDRYEAPTRPDWEDTPLDQSGGPLRPVESPSQTPAPAATVRTYKVAKGDTLSSIARREGVTVADLKAENALSGDTIYVGQELRIPRETDTTAPVGYVYDEAGDMVSASVYTVAKGDTLSHVARRYGVSVATLKRVNNLSGDTIFVGQRLRVPAPDDEAPRAGPARSAPSARAPEPVLPRNLPEDMQTHVVQSGETLSGIARRYGMDPNALAVLNNIDNPRNLSAGQSLLVRADGARPVATPPPSARAPEPEPEPAPVEESRPASWEDEFDVPAVPIVEEDE